MQMISSSTKLADKKLPKVLVCQRGARHRYAVPRLFEELGMLAGLYTDSTRYSPAGQLANTLGKVGVQSAKMKALTSRIPKGIPLDKISSSDLPLQASLFNNMLQQGDLGPLFKKWGLSGANVVYSMCGEDIDFLEWAKQEGAKIVIDIFVHPATARIVETEQLAVTGKISASECSVGAIERHFIRMFELADIILCPSRWVASGVIDFSPQHEGKIRIVPYGSSLNLKDGINESPAVGSILFAGREAIRKGVHHLAEATHILRKKGLEIDVRLAGISAEDIAWMPYHDELNCLGTLPMDRMHHEFENADVFVLPSLSEGQAGVLLEAMACGCPVIATNESGMDFLPDCGISVPSGNPEALADAIESVITDRDKRTRLAEGALRQATDFSLEAWKNRLKKTVEDLL